MIKYKFQNEWNPEEAVCEWQRDGRTKLNKIIQIYNQWQIDGFPQEEKQRLLANIEYGIQTFASEDGCSGYRDVLYKMQQFVTEQSNEEIE